MSEEEFLREKTEYVKEILEIIGRAALNEARLLLDTHKNTGEFLTDISDKISEQINKYKYQLLDYLLTVDLPTDSQDTLLLALFLYCPPLLRTKYRDKILAMPDIHKKAVISCYLASHLVYTRGLTWSPSVADILPLLSEDSDLMK